MMKRLLGLAVLGIGGVACSYELLHYGSFPFDGQTRVPVDAVLEINGWIPESWGDLSNGIRLVDAESGVSVPFTYELQTGRGGVLVRPSRPLEPDTEYMLSGVSSWQVTGSHGMGSMCWGWCGDGLESTRATFSTGGEPRLLAATDHYDDGLFLVFSEPVQSVVELSQTLLVLNYGEEQRALAGVAFDVHELPHLVGFTWDEQQPSDFGADLAVDLRVTFASGETLEIAQDLWIEDAAVLDRFRFETHWGR